jgi:hypothetical protein
MEVPVDELVYIASPKGEGYVGLSRTANGKLYRKMILPMGSFVHPGDPKSKITVDKAMAQTLVDNFNKNYCDTVQVPVVNDSNKHVEDPLRNAGEVIDVDYDETGVYATIDARKYADDFGKTILGASAFMHLNYTDTKTGNKVGPTLLHVAATNRPYITNMSGFEEIAALSADNQSDNPPVLLVAEEEVTLSTTTVKDGPVTKDELIAALLVEGIDVPALQAQAAQAAELSGQLDSVNEQLALSGATGDISIKDLAAGLVELSNSNKTLTTTVETLKATNDELKLSAAEAEVKALIKVGRILPKQEAAMVKLSVEDRETFEALVPEKAIVSLSEVGVQVHEEPEKHIETVTKYTEMAARLNTGLKRK